MPASIPRIFGILALLLMASACGDNRPAPQPAYAPPAPAPVPVYVPPPTIDSFILSVTITADAMPSATPPYVDPDTGQWVQPNPTYVIHDAPLGIGTSVQLIRSDGTAIRLSDSVSAPPEMSRDGNRYAFTFRYQPDQVERLANRPISTIGAFERLRTNYANALFGHELRLVSIDRVEVEVNGRRVTLRAEPTPDTELQLGAGFQAAAAALGQASPGA
ncbi:MAG: hypothetical protein JWR84_3898 [Caulobacter sp.]|nr:hypothetical protein [Caulobacter sp.]